MNNLEIVTTQGTFSSMQEAAAAGVNVSTLRGPMRDNKGGMNRYEDKETYELLSQ